MGWIDFLRKKGQAERDRLAIAEKARQLKGGPAPRPWHYFLTHVALRDIALKSSVIAAALGDPARVKAALSEALTKMAPQLGLGEGEGGERAASQRIASIAIMARRFFSDAPGFVVTMPRPEAPTEAHFAAVVGPAPGRTGSIRYFTLEDAGGDTTHFCEWTADDDHHYFEEHPFASVDAFVAAVNEKL